MESYYIVWDVKVYSGDARPDELQDYVEKTKGNKEVQAAASLLVILWMLVSVPFCSLNLCCSRSGRYNLWLVGCCRLRSRYQFLFLFRHVDKVNDLHVRAISIISLEYFFWKGVTVHQFDRWIVARSIRFDLHPLHLVTNFCLIDSYLFLWFILQLLQHKQRRNHTRNIKRQYFAHNWSHLNGVVFGQNLTEGCAFVDNAVVDLQFDGLFADFPSLNTLNS